MVYGNIEMKEMLQVVYYNMKHGESLHKIITRNSFFLACYKVYKKVTALNV
jgi:hypothetical protein